jgi:hypothetical protein
LSLHFIDDLHLAKPGLSWRTGVTFCWHLTPRIRGESPTRTPSRLHPRRIDP